MRIIRATDSGFFACVFDTMRQIFIARQSRGKFYIKWEKESLYYDEAKGGNVWETYFEQSAPPENYPTGYEVAGYVPVERHGNAFRLFMHNMLHEYARPNEETLKFFRRVEDSWKTGRTVGVHVRLTDKLVGPEKFGEPESARPLDIQTYFKYTDDVLDNLGFDGVYLATDTNSVVQEFVKRYGSRLLCINAPRSEGYKSIHRDLPDASGYLKGLTVLLDGLALAKCNYLVRSTSNVSSYAQFMNLGLNHINLNEVTNGDTREVDFGLTSKIYEGSSNLNWTI